MEVRPVRDGINIPAIWVAIALSVLIHVVALWNWFPELRLHLKEQAERGETRIPLQARLVPPGRAPSASLPVAPQVLQRPAPAARPATQLPQPSTPPPVMALDAPQPLVRTLPPPLPPTPPASVPVPQAIAPVQGDLASLIEARRRARGERATASPPPESEEARRNRIVASNLASQNASSLAFDPNRGGGVFQIQRLGYDRAEFVFYGWNKDINRNSSQLIDVRRGEHADIRLAVVRRMIAIIREHKEEEFTWESPRLGRVITLSARLRDNAGLEDFLMKEFFPG